MDGGDHLRGASSPSDNGRDDDHQEEHGQRKKRQRVTAACDECRTKKIKCDGARPVCAPCRRRDTPTASCTWGIRKVRSAGVSKEQLAVLQRRIDELECAGQYAAPRSHHGPEAPNTPAEGPLPPAEPRGSAAIDGDVNAMMGLIEEETQSVTADFDNSSVAYFMNLIRNLITDQNMQAHGQARAYPALTPHTQASALYPSARPAPAKVLDYVLPPRRKADYLLDTYWRLAYTLYPFLDQDDVMAQYHALWTGEPLGEEAAVFICLLNVIFSIGCIMDASLKPQDRGPAANVFYQRAHAMLSFDLVHSRSVLVVQCFLVLAQFLQSTNKPQQCWNFVGMAIRNAQSLGLNLAATGNQATSDRHRHLLRKVWHGCVLMDRVLSMTLGRPAMITYEAATSVPWPVSHPGGAECECYRQLCGWTADSRECHFFIESLKLYEMMGETLLTLYNPAHREHRDHEGAVPDPYSRYFGPLGVQAAKHTLEMDSKLLLWSRQLPIHLQSRPVLDKSPIHARQTSTLQLQHFHVRILLFRPILARFCARSEHDGDRPADSSMLWNLAFQCSTSCVRTAIDIVSLIGSTTDGRPQEEWASIMPPWWYGIFYVYTAATVLVAARLHPLITADLTEEAIMGAWRGMMRILRSLEPYSPHVRRCRNALSSLIDQVPRDQAHTHAHAHAALQPSQLPPQLPLRRDDLNGLAMGQPSSQREDVSYRPRTSPTDLAQHLTQLDPTPGLNLATSLRDPAYWAMNGSRGMPPLYTAGANDGSLPFDLPDGVGPAIDLQLDMNDMSWLSDIPFKLYNDRLTMTE